MTKLTLAMIVRDAEPTLARALKCVSDLCEELIVVDTGSLDGSVAIAKQMGAEVYQFAWTDDFSAARNHSFEHCTGDWILWLDADDVISESSQRRLLEVKNGSLSEAVDAIYMPYQYAFTASDKCRLTLYRERLVRRQAGLKWSYPVHECIQLPAERSLFVHDIFIEHRPTVESRVTKEPDRNLRIIEKALSSKRSDRMLFYYGNELYDHGRFEEAIAAYQNALDLGGRTWERYWAIRGVSKCHSAMERPDQALAWGLLAIEAAPERAEALNDAGIIYFRQNRMSEAIPFFSAATKLQKPQTSFVEDCHYGWLPYDYLSSCYLATGDYEKALENGLKALPDHPDQGRLQENIKFLVKLTK